jgi:DnaJ-class molecular chaperone
MRETEPRRVWRTCARCQGTGGPPSHFDEESRRWQHYTCSQCSGTGAGWTWSDNVEVEHA